MSRKTDDADAKGWALRKAQEKKHAEAFEAMREALVDILPYAEAEERALSGSVSSEETEVEFHNATISISKARDALKLAEEVGK